MPTLHPPLAACPMARNCFIVQFLAPGFPGCDVVDRVRDSEVLQGRPRRDIHSPRKLHRSCQRAKAIPVAGKCIDEQGNPHKFIAFRHKTGSAIRHKLPHNVDAAVVKDRQRHAEPDARPGRPCEPAHRRCNVDWWIVAPLGPRHCVSRSSRDGARKGAIRANTLL